MVALIHALLVFCVYSTSVTSNDQAAAHKRKRTASPEQITKHGKTTLEPPEAAARIQERTVSPSEQITKHWESFNVTLDIEEHKLTMKAIINDPVR
jgi:hypothetical protein